MKKKKQQKEKALPLIYQLPGNKWCRISCIGTGIGLFAVWLCFHSLRAIPAAFPVAVFYGSLLYQEEVEKNRQLLRVHFSEYLTAVHMAVRSGYSLENAVRSGTRDLTALYGHSDLLVRELERLIRQMDYRVPVEKLFTDLGNRSGVPEMRSFGEMIRITKRTGGNLGKVLGDTWRILNRRLETEMEIATLITSKKYEQSVMSLMPAGMILYLRFAFPGFVEHLYGNTFGILVMSAALLLYLGAYAIGRYMVRIEV